MLVQYYRNNTEECNYLDKSVNEIRFVKLTNDTFISITVFEKFIKVITEKNSLK